MECFKVTGGRRLNGEVQIQGAKNAVLPIMAASLLGGGVSRLEACPELSDFSASVEILLHLGSKLFICLLSADSPGILIGHH